MSFVITQRAFRFEVAGTQYALDVLNDGIVYSEPAVHLFHMTAQGWHRVHAEMEPVIVVRQEQIDAAGGVMQLCKLIVAKVNRALAILHGDDDVVIPPGAEAHEVVADYLREHLRLEVIDGVPQLALSA